MSLLERKSVPSMEIATAALALRGLLLQLRTTILGAGSSGSCNERENVNIILMEFYNPVNLHTSSMEMKFLTLSFKAAGRSTTAAWSSKAAEKQK
jgi:hypothetical protein